MLAALLPAVGMMLFGAQAAPQTPYATIAGVVLNDSTGAPIPRAQVALSTTGATPLNAVTYTDSFGGFAFSYIPPGRYLLYAMADGYEGGGYEAPTPYHPPSFLELSEGQQRLGLTLRLRQLGAISGIVLDPDGDPVSGAEVQLLVRGYSRRKPSNRLVKAAPSNDRGEYRLYHIEPGTYAVMARHPAQVTVPGQPVNALGTQFYPNADRMSAAAMLTVDPGKQLTGIDFRLPPRRTIRLKVNVSFPPGLPNGTQVRLQVYPEDQPGEVNGSFFIGARNAADLGSQFAEMAPGTYVISAQCSADGHDYAGVERVELTRDSEEVTVPLTTGVELAGKVAFESDENVERPAFQVQLIPGDALAAAGRARPAEMKPDGTFRIPDVTPGLWDISVQPLPPGGYLKAIRLGDQDVLTEDMFIRPDTSAPLNIIVSARGGVVEGGVLDEGGGEKPVRAAVLLAPEGKFADVESFYMMTNADNSGHFELKGVTPGTYRLYAFDRMLPDFVQNPEGLKPYRTRGEPLAVEEGGRVTIQVRRIAVTPAAGAKGKR
jgi:Carboxypeptidase regulatory-like domain/Polysaccharide lyase family 4, domain II